MKEYTVYTIHLNVLGSDLPLTHLKTSSALFRHQGIVISYKRQDKR